MEQVLLSIPQQVEKALDGRTQRWLALQIRVHETDLSKKMKGKISFSDNEIKEINKVLKCKIKL